VSLRLLYLIFRGCSGWSFPLGMRRTGRRAFDPVRLGTAGAPSWVGYYRSQPLLEGTGGQMVASPPVVQVLALAGVSDHVGRAIA
jgi:hypothetical protein